MISDAFTILRAVVAWIVVCAAVVTLALLGAVWLGVVTWRAVRRGVRRPSWARGRIRARLYARRCARARDTV